MPAKPASSPRPRPSALLAAVALSVANLFLHKPISDVFDALYSRVGRRWYEIISFVLIGSLATVAAVPALRRLGRALAATWLPATLLGLTVLTVASQRWLLVTNIELIHFPQFALIAVLLLMAGAEPRVAWLGGTVAGLFDETYQHLVLYAGVPNTYFDINDILLNSIGAAWGVCLFGADRLAGGRRARRFGLAAALAILAVGGALYLDPPDRVLLRPAATRKLYRVLSTGEGLVGILAVAGLIELAAIPRRHKVRTGPAGLEPEAQAPK